jgi:hypothetical protein
VSLCCPREGRILATLNRSLASNTGLTAIKNEMLKGSAIDGQFSYDYDNAHVTISDVVRLFSLFTFTREFDTCEQITVGLTFSPGHLDSLIDVLQDLQRRNNKCTFDSFHVVDLPYVEEHVLQHFTSLVPAAQLDFDSPLSVAPAGTPNQLIFLPSSSIRSLAINLDTTDDSSPDEKHFCSWLTVNIPNLEELDIDSRCTPVHLTHMGLITLCYFCAPSLQSLNLNLSKIDPLHLRHLLETTPGLKSLTIFALDVQYSEMTRKPLELPDLVELSANVLMHLTLLGDLIIVAGNLKELSVRCSLEREKPGSSEALCDAFFKIHWEDNYPDLEVLHYTCVKGWGNTPYPFSIRAHTGRALTQLRLSFFGFSDQEVWVGGEPLTST